MYPRAFAVNGNTENML